MANASPQGNQGSPRQLEGIDSQLRRRMQYSVDFFHAYRRGQLREWRQQDADGLRLPIYSRYEVPLRRISPATPNGQPEDMPLLQAGADRPRYPRGGDNDRNRQQYEAEVRNGQYGIMDQLRPLGFRLQKILGVGGEGIACLFKMIDVNNQTHTIVVKAARRIRPGSGAVTREKDNSEYQSSTCVSVRASSSGEDYMNENADYGSLK